MKSDVTRAELMRMHIDALKMCNFIDPLVGHQPAYEFFEGCQPRSENIMRGEWKDSNHGPTVFAQPAGCFYRIKPAPQIRPYNNAELRELVGKVVKNKSVDAYHLVRTYECCHVKVGAAVLNALDLLDCYTLKGGAACGVAE